MNRPKKEDFFNKEPKVIEIFGDKMINFIEFEIVRTKYIDYLENKINEITKILKQ